MATNDPIPLFLSDHTEGPEQPVIGKDRAVMSSRIVKTSILVVMAAAIVLAMLSGGNPLVLFENAMASLVAASTPQDDTSQSMPSIQSTADAQALPPAASEAPTGGEKAAAFNAAAFKAADQSQTEIRQPPADVLLNQFQAWAAQEDAQEDLDDVDIQQHQPWRGGGVQERGFDCIGDFQIGHLPAQHVRHADQQQDHAGGL